MYIFICIVKYFLSNTKSIYLHFTFCNISLGRINCCIKCLFCKTVSIISNNDKASNGMTNGIKISRSVYIFIKLLNKFFCLNALSNI